MWWTSQAFSEILFYQGTDGSVPFTNWLNSLPPVVRDQCIFKLDQLDEIGLVDYLRDGIHYLRIATRRSALSDVLLRALPPRLRRLARLRRRQYRMGNRARHPAPP